MTKTTFSTLSIVFILIAITFSLPLSGLSTDLYAPSLPYIARYFHVGGYWAQYTMSTFILGFGLGQLPFGIASDAWGRKPIFMLSILLYAVMSYFCIYASHISHLLILRGLQGFAVAGASTVAKSTISDSFSGHRLNAVYNYGTTAWGLGPICGPFIGGYLQHHYNWQAAFYFFSAYGIALLIFLIFCYPETHRNPQPIRLSHMRQNAMTLLSSSKFMSAIIAMGLSYGLLLMFHVVAPFLIQNTLGYNAITYGTVSIALGVAFVIGTFLNQIALRFYSLETIIRATSCLLLLVSLSMLAYNLTHPLTLISLVAPITVLNLFVGTIYGNCMAIALRNFKHMAGMASATLGTVAMLSLTLCTVLAALLPDQSTIDYNYLYTGVIFCIVLLVWGSASRHPQADS